MAICPAWTACRFFVKGCILFFQIRKPCATLKKCRLPELLCHDWAAQHLSQGGTMAPCLRADVSGLDLTHMNSLYALPKPWNEHGAVAPSPSA